MKRPGTRGAPPGTAGWRWPRAGRTKWVRRRFLTRICGFSREFEGVSRQKPFAEPLSRLRARGAVDGAMRHGRLVVAVRREPRRRLWCRALRDADRCAAVD